MKTKTPYLREDKTSTTFLENQLLRQKIIVLKRKHEFDYEKIKNLYDENIVYSNCLKQEILTLNQHLKSNENELNHVISCLRLEMRTMKMLYERKLRSNDHQYNDLIMRHTEQLVNYSKLKEKYGYLIRKNNSKTITNDEQLDLIVRENEHLKQTIQNLIKPKFSVNQQVANVAENRIRDEYNMKLESIKHDLEHHLRDAYETKLQESIQKAQQQQQEEVEMLRKKIRHLQIRDENINNIHNEITKKMRVN
ncbi:unnamed protein product [Didymodactylos carnosus]|uniref:Uncharacterized protein n=1 Tax=Didymodactylos carnosus TaxID=1234261 RepID=A0A813YAP9_9BILA|nr:unnamed protein product [Didymodactylos carnosus]CAF0881533.1 unnamed protein product [Didymodactylos carnosus]CAF3607991.1 unnamed protein product [Didymodactylos carnosus]CAF3667643.1 unnamed protein product [Didymodactylos carnosus]